MRHRIAMDPGTRDRADAMLMHLETFNKHVDRIAPRLDRFLELLYHLNQTFTRLVDLATSLFLVWCVIMGWRILRVSLRGAAIAKKRLFTPKETHQGQLGSSTEQEES